MFHHRDEPFDANSLMTLRRDVVQSKVEIVPLSPPFFVTDWLEILSNVSLNRPLDFGNGISCTRSKASLSIKEAIAEKIDNPQPSELVSSKNGLFLG